VVSRIGAHCSTARQWQASARHDRRLRGELHAARAEGMATSSVATPATHVAGALISRCCPVTVLSRAA
jgi:hypothetical protein